MATSITATSCTTTNAAGWPSIQKGARRAGVRLFEVDRAVDVVVPFDHGASSVIHSHLNVVERPRSPIALFALIAQTWI